MDTQFINQLITGGAPCRSTMGDFTNRIYVYIYIDFYIQRVYNGDLQKQHYDKWGMAIHSIGGILLFIKQSGGKRTSIVAATVASVEHGQ